MSSRRTLRRGRLRRRPARFDNRTRKPSWLPPSLASVRANILTNVKHIREPSPISRILIESYRFDPRLMQDLNVSGKEYQHSERRRPQARSTRGRCPPCPGYRGPWATGPLSGWPLLRHPGAPVVQTVEVEVRTTGLLTAGRNPGDRTGPACRTGARPAPRATRAMRYSATSTCAAGSSLAAGGTGHEPTLLPRVGPSG